jgi:23S rRNA pseudouridine2605 synthase
MSERIQKILSQWGVASRRHAEELILQGRVRLNGTVVKLGDKADPSRDRKKERELMEKFLVIGEKMFP